MSKVSFTGWQPGFQKIKFNALLRYRLGLSLSEAKAIVDAILEGEMVVLESGSMEDAADLLVQAKALGVVGELVD